MGGKRKRGKKSDQTNEDSSRKPRGFNILFNINKPASECFSKDESTFSRELIDKNLHILQIIMHSNGNDK